MVVSGVIRSGNILPGTRRPVLNNDGSYSTVRSMSFQGPDGYEYLIPTTAEDGSGILPPTDAIAQYRKTGKFLGMFSNPASAIDYAKNFHDIDQYMYNNGLDYHSAINSTTGYGTNSEWYKPNFIKGFLGYQ